MNRTDELRAHAAQEVRRLSVPLTEFRAEDADDAEGAIIIRGHAAVFDRLSEELPSPYGMFREKIARGAFRKALDESQDVRALINHDDYPVLARTTSGTLDLREDPRGLHAYMTLPDTQWARDLRASMNRGDIDKMSFGFTVAADEWRFENEGTDDEQITRTVQEVERLFDVSVVTFPAYPQTEATARAVTKTTSTEDPEDGDQDDNEDGSPDSEEKRTPPSSWHLRRRVAKTRADRSGAQNQTTTTEGAAENGC